MLGYNDYIYITLNSSGTSEFICWGSYFYYFSIFFIILDTPTPPHDRLPKYPKILGCIYTSPMCFSLLRRSRVPKTWWNISHKKCSLQ